jgi:hypothetical protein
MKSRLAGFLAITVLAAGLAGCAKVPAGSTPASPQSPYQKAATIMSDFSADLVSAQQVVISLHTGGAIDDTTYKTVQAAFGQVATYGPQIDALISAQAASPTILAKVSSALNALSLVATSTGKLDPNTAAQIKVAVQALELLLSQLNTTFATTTSALEVNHGSSFYRIDGRAVSSARHAGLPADRGVFEGGGNAREAALRDPRRGGRELRQGLASLAILTT